MTRLTRLVTKLPRLEARLSLPVTKLSSPVTKITPPVTEITTRVTNLRITAQFAKAIVMRVRRHYPAVRALGGNLAAERFTLSALGHCEIRKTTHDYRNGEEYLDHVPTLLHV